MLKGKIIQDGSRYCVMAGTVSIDVTDDLRGLLAQEQEKHDREQWALRTNHADTLKRYAAIESIVLAGGGGMPTG